MIKPRTVALEKDDVVIEWKDGHRSVYPNAALREACPCALCQGEARPLGGGRSLPTVPQVPEGVRALKCRTVGLYALGFTWSDGHETGIYPYDYLRRICGCPECASKRLGP